MVHHRSASLKNQQHARRRSAQAPTVAEEPGARGPGRGASAHRRIWPDSQLTEANAARVPSYSSARSSSSAHMSKKQRLRQDEPTREHRRHTERGRSSKETSASSSPGRFRRPREPRGAWAAGEAEASPPARSEPSTSSAGGAGRRRPSRRWHSEPSDHPVGEGPEEDPPQHVARVRSEPWRMPGSQASAAEEAEGGGGSPQRRRRSFSRGLQTLWQRLRRKPRSREEAEAAGAEGVP